MLSCPVPVDARFSCRASVLAFNGAMFTSSKTRTVMSADVTRYRDTQLLMFAHTVYITLWKNFDLYIWSKINNLDYPSMMKVRKLILIMKFHYFISLRSFYNYEAKITHPTMSYMLLKSITYNN